MKLSDLKVGQRITLTLTGTVLNPSDTWVNIQIDGNRDSNTFYHSTEVENLKVKLPDPAVGDTLTPKNPAGTKYTIEAIIGEYWVVTYQGNNKPTVYPPSAFEYYTRTPKEAT